MALQPLTIAGDDDELYMRRAIQLARCGRGRTRSNPMVGAVITARGRIIGEGCHRTYGEAHAEVNAINSISEADLHLLPEATIYVTLEPCSHYGKTPPCAKLIIEKGIRRVVVGVPDPFREVAGRGISMLREAGCSVSVGVLEKECRELNRRFMFAHENGLPYVQLKWVQSADGFIGSAHGKPRAILSNPLSMTLMHQQRADASAIAVGVNTIISDNPRLTCTLWPGNNPMKLSRESERIPDECNFKSGDFLLRKRDESLEDFLRRIYKEHNILSVMVEGGRETLQEFIDAGLFNEIRLEVSNLMLKKGTKAPKIDFSQLKLHTKHLIRENMLLLFQR